MSGNIFGKVSKLSPVPSLAKLRGSKGFPPTSSKPVALRAQSDVCAALSTNAEDDAAREARRAAVSLAMVALLIHSVRKRVLTSIHRRLQIETKSHKFASNVTEVVLVCSDETKDLLQLYCFHTICG
jgi:hypothetical protein